MRVNFNDGETLTNGELIAADTEGIVVQWADGGRACAPWRSIRMLEIAQDAGGARPALG